MFAHIVALFHISFLSTQIVALPKKPNVLLNRGAVLNIASRIDTKDERIVRGHEATPYEFPWIVELRMRGYHLCGGTILNPNFIITAAHCVESAEDFIEVVAGDHNVRCLEGREQIRKVLEIRTHFLYDTITVYHDLAIIQVDEPFTFNRYVGKATLAQREEDITGNPFLNPMDFASFQNARVMFTAYAEVAGWGVVEFKKPVDPTLFPDKLLKATVARRNATFCGTAYGLRFNSAFMACYGSQGKSACKGDSGGPWMCGNSKNLCAVHSGTRECGLSNYPSIVTKVPAYLDWIKNNSDINKSPPPIILNKCGGHYRVYDASIILKNVSRGLQCFWSFENQYNRKSFANIELTLHAEDEIWVASAGNICHNCPATKQNLQFQDVAFFEGYRVTLMFLKISNTSIPVQRDIHINFISAGSRDTIDRETKFIDLRRPKGGFRFPEPGSAVYHHSTVMLAFIVPEDGVGKHTILSIRDMDIASDPQDTGCRGDALSIYQLEDGVFKELRRECGTKKPRLFGFYSGYVIVSFVSTKESPYGRGFRIDYSLASLIERPG